MQELIQEWLHYHSVLVSILLLIGIEISPVKWNPITWFGKLWGKLLGIDDLKEQIKEIDKKVDENERDRIRYEILQFAGSLRNGLTRTSTDYQHIEELYSKYHDTMHCNSYITSEMEYIRAQKNKSKRKRTNSVDK
jgi:hypothetical protein